MSEQPQPEGYSTITPQAKAALVVYELVMNGRVTNNRIKELTGLSSTSGVNHLMSNLAKAIPIHHDGGQKFSLKSHQNPTRPDSDMPQVRAAAVAFKLVTSGTITTDEIRKLTGLQTRNGIRYLMMNVSAIPLYEKDDKIYKLLR